MELRLPFGRSKEAVCYEVQLAIAPQRAEEFDSWLADHVREMLAFPGFQDACVYTGPEPDEDGREIRVVAYEVRSRRELDSYLRTHASRMRAEGKQRFGNDLAATREIVPLADYEPEPGLAVLLSADDISGGLPICGNCHKPVEGRYCANCGQEDRTYLLSLRELLGEFFSELTDLDSRFFRSLKPLLFRPGWLTLEYVRGRRQYYLPPMRMYIIISLIFFFLMALMTDTGFVIDAQDKEADEDPVVAAFNDEDEDRQEAIEALRAQLDGASGAQREVIGAALRQLEAAREQTDAGADEQSAADAATEDTGDTEVAAQPGSSGEAAASDESAADDPDEGESDVNIDPDWNLPQLNMNNGKATASGWGSEELNRRMERGAEYFKDNPKVLAREMMDNIPPMMFVFLPLLALALKVLYLFSRRYYVEHLTFLLHIHSAVFLVLLFWMLLGELADILTPMQRVMGWITAATWIYIPVYLYKSMRRVYGQGHVATSLKFFLLAVCYLTAAVFTSVFVLVATVFQQA